MHSPLRPGAAELAELDRASFAAVARAARRRWAELTGPLADLARTVADVVRERELTPLTVAREAGVPPGTVAALFALDGRLAAVELEALRRWAGAGPRGAREAA
ncbi:hypothetical protein [Frankia sp. AgKG'84/4]|uniref:hypothetical protein n=1 Tax=Frankia sp. AgKG'84/4 TaxID=573490 RepID=UPI002010C072|nr:hypothetical protein [Frankia sp. AgKG'84/4]MCL9793779.1 hypothetical protein [Frankia sp. AgKG'84/4]